MSRAQGMRPSRKLILTGETVRLFAEMTPAFAAHTNKDSCACAPPVTQQGPGCAKPAARIARPRAQLG